MQDDWVELLPMAEFVYNNADYDSIRMLPNEAIYRQTLDICQSIEDDPQRGKISAVCQNVQLIVQKRQQLEESWQKTKEFYTKWYNKKH